MNENQFNNSINSLLNIPGFRTPYKPNVVNGYVDLLSGDICFNWYVWKRFLQIQNYHIGLFENTTDDDAFENVESEFFRVLWLYGEIFVTFFDGEFQFWNIVKKYGKGVKVDELDVQLITENLQPYHQNFTNIKRFKNLVHGFYLTWLSPNSSYPAIVLWWDYVQMFSQLELQFLNNTIWDSKKFIYIQNNNDGDITGMEIASMMDRNTPFIKSVSPTSILGKQSQVQNLFQRIESGESMSQLTFDNLLNYTNYIYNNMGVMSQVNLKKERKTTSESSQDLYNTINIENITLRNLKKFAKFAKKFGHNLEFKKTTDLAELSQVKENENFGENNDEKI